MLRVVEPHVYVARCASDSALARAFTGVPGNATAALCWHIVVPANVFKAHVSFLRFAAQQPLREGRGDTAHRSGYSCGPRPSSGALYALRINRSAAIARACDQKPLSRLTDIEAMSFITDKSWSVKMSVSFPHVAHNPSFEATRLPAGFFLAFVVRASILRYVPSVPNIVPKRSIQESVSLPFAQRHTRHTICPSNTEEPKW